MKNINICKKCWKERTKKEEDFTLWEIMMDVSEDTGWTFQYCNLESFNKDTPPPDQCPYILEHTVNQDAK